MIEIRNSDLEKINIKNLLSELRFTLLDTENGIAFTSDELNEYDTLKEVFRVAKKLRAALTGPSMVDPNFILGDVIEVDTSPQRHHKIIELLPGKYEISGETIGLKVSPPKGLSIDQKKIWKITNKEKKDNDKFKRQRTRFLASYFNPKADEIMDLCDRKSLTGTDVYKLYELMEGEPSNRVNFHSDFGIEKEQFKRFKDAVHNRKVTGNWARHAKEEEPKSENPMTKKEAIKFIKDLGERWLELQANHLND